MSLVTSASPWINDDNSKKRQSTMRRTFKVKPLQTISSEEPDEYISTSENFQNSQPPSIEETQNSMNDRTDRVNDLLNKITSVDSTNETKMGSFNPMPNPNINIKKDMSDSTGIGTGVGTDMDTGHRAPPLSYFNASNPQKNGNFAANDTPAHIFSNYRMSYEQPVIFANEKSKYLQQQQTHVAAPPDNKLLEKINYMIHLLEEQQLEKTNNITEEFILYTFLGVFIIFVVDSFARSGKYTR